MDPKEEIKARLAKLGPVECKVLKLRCQGLEYKAIAQELVVTESTIKSHMANIYVKLGMEQLRRNVRTKFLMMAVSPVLAEVGCQSGRKGDDQPGAVMVIQQGVLRLIDEDDYAFTPPLLEPPKSIAPYRPTNPPIIIPGGEMVPKLQPNPWKWLLAGLLLGILVISGAAFAFREPIIQWLSQPTSPPSVVEVIITTTPAPLAASATPKVLVVTATAPPASPTPIATDTATPTAPVPPGTLLFFDEFSTSDIDSRWIKVDGAYFIQDGQLTTSNYGVWFALPVTVKNFRIELDVFTTDYNSSVISPAFSDPSNYLGFAWYRGRGWWRTVTNGSGSDRGEKETPGRNTPRTLAYSIEVVNDVMNVTVGDLYFGSLSNPAFSYNQIGLSISRGTWIDNVRVIALQ